SGAKNDDYAQRTQSRLRQPSCQPKASPLEVERPIPIPKPVQHLPSPHSDGYLLQVLHVRVPDCVVARVRLRLDDFGIVPPASIVVLVLAGLLRSVLLREDAEQVSMPVLLAPPTHQDDV